MIVLKHALRNLAEEGEAGGAAEAVSNGADSEQGGSSESLIEALKRENEALKNKTSELLSETKKAKELRREAEESARREAEEKARKQGDWEQLHKSSEQERQKLQQSLEQLNNSIAQEKQRSTAMQIANELADGHNAEILSEFISRRLRFTEDGIKITDNSGQLTVSTLDQLKAEFQTSEKFASLVRGTKAQGGGAPGGAASGQVDKIMTRAQFDELNPFKKSEFIKKGGRTVD